MNGNGFIVPPLSWSKIENNTLKWRRILGLENDPFFSNNGGFGESSRQ